VTARHHEGHDHVHTSSANRRGRNVRRAAVAGFIGLVTWATAWPAAAEGAGAELGILPVGQSTSFFDLTMRPGDARTLEVEFTNNGDAQATAQTYAADVHTNVNGGFGGALRDEPTTGTTQWLDYDAGTLHLAAGARTRRAFTVTVPADTGPGEYITSLVLETEKPMTTEDGEAAALERHAIAVVVTVPGARSPALEIGEASHGVVEGVSVLSVAVSNPGNVRLSPIVDLTVSDADDRRVTQVSVQMDSFYAATDTSVEVALDTLLPSGAYSLELVAEDVQQEVRATASLAFVVGGDGGGGIIGSLMSTMRLGSTDIPVLLVIAILVGVTMVAGTMRLALSRRRGMATRR
jgi:hypothetical protein